MCKVGSRHGSLDFLRNSAKLRGLGAHWSRSGRSTQGAKQSGLFGGFSISTFVAEINMIPSSLQLRAHLPPPLRVELEAASGSPEDYDRNGYLPDFLGEGSDFLVPLPLPKDKGDLVLVEQARKERPFELQYQNFSVVMSRYRRFCMITGVNIDGSAPFFRFKRPGWKIDPRIPKAAQVDGPEFYVLTVFDRGHMVRRLDPVWGIEGAARLANADTHHYTNSCPQVHSFNDTTWGDLEDWILSQERSRDSKGSVFTGPILQESDSVYQGVKVPVALL